MTTPSFYSAAMFQSGFIYGALPPYQAAAFYRTYLSGNEVAYPPPPPSAPSDTHMHIDPYLSALDASASLAPAASAAPAAPAAPVSLPSQMVPLPPSSVASEEPLQRFLEDGQSTSFFQPIPPTSVGAAFNASYGTSSATITSAGQVQSSTIRSATSAPAVVAAYPNSPYASTYDLASISNAHSPSYDSDPCYDFETMPSTPGDQGSVSYRRLSPQPAPLLFTGSNPVLSDCVNPKDISTMLVPADTSDTASDITPTVSVGHNLGGYPMDNAPTVGFNAGVPRGPYGDCELQYNYMDRGYTLLSSPGHEDVEMQQQNLHQHQQFLVNDGTVIRVASPEPMLPPSRTEKHVTDTLADGTKVNDSVVVKLSDPQDQPAQSNKRRRVMNKGRIVAEPSQAATEPETATAIGSARASRKRKVPQAASPTPPKPLAPSPVSKETLCSVCQEVFKSPSALEVHARKEHRKPFSCIFAFAGCASTFGNKNEWKRHVSTQHLKLAYWMCSDPACEKMRNSISAGASVIGGDCHAGGRSIDSTNSSIFNRKDLFTQHVRRMHMPEFLRKEQARLDRQSREQPKPSKGARGKKRQARGKRWEAGGNDGGGGAGAPPVPPAQFTPSTPSPALQQWNAQLLPLQRQSEFVRCVLPTAMTCPVASCGQQFHGGNAWGDRMEHVARHMQAAFDNSEPPIVCGGSADPTLMEWAVRVEVVRRVLGADGKPSWQVHDPLMPPYTPSQHIPAHPDDAEEDGEGDDDDDLMM